MENLTESAVQSQAIQLASNQPQETTPATEPKRRRTGTLPRKDSQIKLILDTIIEKLPTSGYTCNNVTLESLSLKRDNYLNAIVSKHSNSSERSAAKQSIKTENNLIDEGVSAIKKLLGHDFGTRGAIDHYKSFGITKVKNKYIMRTAINDRLLDLPEMINGLNKYNITSEKYGVEFWQERIQNLKTLTADTGNQAGEISKSVAVKNQLKETIYDDFNSIIHLIKCNVHKDSHKSELRAWNFLKERY